MAYEFVIKYCGTEKLTDSLLEDIKRTILNKSRNDVLFEFIIQNDYRLAFGFKFKIIPEHDWIWDGYLYINDSGGFILFNTGSKMQMLDFIENLLADFLKINVQILIEED